MIILGSLNILLKIIHLFATVKQKLLFLWIHHIIFDFLMISSGLSVKDNGISGYLMGYCELDKCSNELIVEQIIILGRK